MAGFLSSKRKKRVDDNILDPGEEWCPTEIPQLFRMRAQWTLNEQNPEKASSDWKKVTSSPSKPRSLVSTSAVRNLKNIHIFHVLYQ